nr:hypothetical protein [Flavobacterium franklandianum]
MDSADLQSVPTKLIDKLTEVGSIWQDFKAYHSFTLLASIFIKIKSKIVKPQSPEPPYEKKGNGTPMVGKTRWLGHVK